MNTAFLLVLVLFLFINGSSIHVVSLDKENEEEMEEDYPLADGGDPA
jgi:hypothetical protein